jgi:Zn-dependent peptidase ImmA (M78 family)
MKAKLFNFNYTIKDVPSLTADDGASLFGDINYNDCIIRLNTANSKERKSITLLHEVLHGYNHQLCLWHKDEVEKECERLSEIFYNFMVNNKDIVKQIIS